ncbi:MAG: TRAP transporter fused permease subunit [Pseudomonadota bacterium]|nr:TRAP transporter fused permease subunit [Pseudomonadota bacterium]
MTRALDALNGVVFFALALFALWTACFGGFDPIWQRGLAVAGAFAAVVCARRLARPHRGLAVLDLGLVAIFLWGVWLFMARTAEAVDLFIDYSPLDQWSALAATLALIEITRREFGGPLAAMAALCLGYCFAGPWLPGALYHAGFSLDQSMQFVWYGFQGVFGMPVGVVLDTILVFIVFGVALGGTGAADALMKVAFALTGRLRGGPAHAAIVSSCVFGTMSGSVTANVVGTGTFTIPMIRKRGFPPVFAGARETAASTGGPIMPPVWGAAAFLMADLTGTPYAQVCLAALAPALLYYLSLFLSVIFEVRRIGVQPIPKAERLRLTRTDLVRSLSFAAPIAVIVAVLAMGRSPALAGFWATVAALVFGLVNAEFRADPLRILRTLREAGAASANILIAVAGIGVILAVLNLTGIGLTFASLVNAFAGDSLPAALMLTAAASLVLGMGMPTVPAYLVIVLVLGPTLRQLGVETIAMHLLVLYFGVMSALTPPVALAAFAAAPIAGANPLRIGVRAMRLAMVGFLMPFAFVLDPSLLLIGDFDLLAWIWAATKAALATWLAASAAAGWDAARLSAADRIAALAAALAIISAGTVAAPVGVAAGLALLARRRVFARAATPDAPEEPSPRNNDRTNERRTSGQERKGEAT